MTDVNVATSRLDIGAVFTRTFQVVGSAFPTLALLALLFAVLPQAAFGYLTLSLTDANSADPFQMLPLLAIGAPALLITAALFQAAVIRTTALSLDGRAPSFGAAVATAIGHLLPIIGISIVVGLAFMLGFLLLIIPGVFLAIIWSVVIPVRVVEGKGVFASMERSRELTKGSRWMILLIGIIFFVAAWILGAIGGALGYGIAMAVGGGLQGLTSPMGLWPNQVVVSPLVAGFTSMIGSVGGSVIYAELRRIKEGAGPNSLAAIFD